MATHNTGADGSDSTSHRATKIMFPADDGGNVSSVFVVQDHPTVIRGFSLNSAGRAAKIVVEMVDEEACDEERFDQFAPMCGPVVLTATRNVGLIAIPGRYRLVLLDVLNNEPLTAQTAASAYEGIRVTIHRASMRQEVLAAYICQARCSCA